MATPFKVSLLAVGATVTAGAGVTAVGGYHYFSLKNASIADALKDSKLISNLSGNALTRQWEEEFESAKADIKTLISFASDDKVAGGKALAKWCDDQMSLDSVKHKDVLKNVKNYCLVRSISNQLIRANKTLLGSSHTTEWTTTYQKRSTQQTSRSDVNLVGEWSGSPQQSQDLETIKIWCSSNSGRDFLATEDLYTKVLKWCTKEGATTD